MSNKKWCRLYTDFAQNKKIQQLSHTHQRHLIMLYCLTTQNNREYNDNYIVNYLNITEIECLYLKNNLLKNKLIDKNWQLIDSDKLQKASDTSAKRTQIYRQKKRLLINIDEKIVHIDSLKFNQIDEKKENVTSHLQHPDFCFFDKVIHSFSKCDVTFAPNSPPLLPPIVLLLYYYIYILYIIYYINKQTHRERECERESYPQLTHCDVTVRSDIVQLICDDVTDMSPCPQISHIFNATNNKRDKDMSTSDKLDFCQNTQDLGTNDEDVKLTITLSDDTQFVVTQTYLDFLNRTYPTAQNILHTLHKIRSWNLLNIKKRKTRGKSENSGIRKHIHSWIKKELDDKIKTAYKTDLQNKQQNKQGYYDDATSTTTSNYYNE